MAILVAIVPAGVMLWAIWGVAVEAALLDEQRRLLKQEREALNNADQ